MYHFVRMGSGDIKAPLDPVSISQEDFPLLWEQAAKSGEYGEVKEKMSKVA